MVTDASTDRFGAGAALSGPTPGTGVLLYVCSNRALRRSRFTATVISKLFFESTWLLLILLGAVQTGVIAAWFRRRDRLWARCVRAGFVVIPLMLVLSRLVVTPAERIIGLCYDLAAMVQNADSDGIAQHLAADFATAGYDREGFLEGVREMLTRYKVDHANLRRFEVAFPSADRAVAVFDVVCRVHSTDLLTDWLPSRWRVTFRDRVDSWKVTAIEALPAPFSPIRSIRDCLP